MLVVVIGLILLGVVLAIPTAILVVAAQGKAKKRAYELLEEPASDHGEIRKVIKVLNSAKDAESQELVRRLMVLQ